MDLFFSDATKFLLNSQKTTAGFLEYSKTEKFGFWSNEKNLDIYDIDQKFYVYLLKLRWKKIIDDNFTKEYEEKYNFFKQQIPNWSGFQKDKISEKEQQFIIKNILDGI